MFCLYYSRAVLLLLVALVVIHSGLIRGHDTRSNESQTVKKTVEQWLSQYVDSEKALWKIIRFNGDDPELTVYKIYETHERYMGINFGEIGIFGLVREELAASYRELVVNMAYVNTTYEHGYGLLSNRMYNDLPDYTSDVIKRLPSPTSGTKRAILKKPFWKAVIDSTRHCRKNSVFILAESQVLNEIYKELVTILLKSYIATQFSYMIETANGVANHQPLAEGTRSSLKVDVTLIQDTAKELSTDPTLGREMWACDPNNFTREYSYVEVTRFYQGFIANEINLNSRADCKLSCSEYLYSWQFNCRDGTYCSNRNAERRHSICRGNIQNCISIESDMTICTAHVDSPRRYEYVKYNNGRVLGVERYCPAKVTVKSWWDWFYKCDNCFCYCDDPGQKEERLSDSDRYFSLRAAVSDVTENKIVTGVSIVKKNRIIQLQIAQRQLLPGGAVNTTNDDHYPDAQWKTAELFNIDDDNIDEYQDYVSISWANRSIALTSAVIDNTEHIVTGVRFRKFHNHIRLEIRATRFDYTKGQLIEPGKSYWIGNTARLRELRIPRPDVPTKSRQRSIPIVDNNNFIQFQPTDIDKDAAQTTVPFLDATKLEANVPLSGVGLHYRTTYGYGGFIGPKLIVFDFAKYIEPVSYQ